MYKTCISSFCKIVNVAVYQVNKWDKRYVIKALFCQDWGTSSLMMVALLRDLSAEVIFLPRSANTMTAIWVGPVNDAQKMGAKDPLSAGYLAG